MTEPVWPVKEAGRKGEYVVLRRLGEPARPTWEHLGRFNGPAQSAIKEAAGTPPKEGAYLAIPARSYHPVDLKTKTETRVTLS